MLQRSGRDRENRNATPNRTRIMVVDDHPLVRERLCDVINREPQMCVCGEAADHHGALELIPTSNPDLIVVDLTLKRSHGFDLIKDIRVRHPNLLILVVSMHDESLHAERALRAGAHGYVCKQQATKDLISAIRKVLDGEVYMTEALAVRIACKVTGHRRQEPYAPDQLSDRELRIFELIGQGCRVAEIAEQLHLDAKTVETYRMRIKEKLNLKDANEVLKHAIQWGRNLSSL